MNEWKQKDNRWCLEAGVFELEVVQQDGRWFYSVLDMDGQALDSNNGSCGSDTLADSQRSAVIALIAVLIEAGKAVGLDVVRMVELADALDGVCIWTSTHQSD